MNLISAEIEKSAVIVYYEKTKDKAKNTQTSFEKELFIIFASYRSLVKVVDTISQTSWEKASLGMSSSVVF
jgi:hypothetical protein